jgi:hypothetical protein
MYFSPGQADSLDRWITGNYGDDEDAEEVDGEPLFDTKEEDRGER